MNPPPLLIDPFHRQLLATIQVQQELQIYACHRVMVLQFKLTLPQPVVADQRFQKFLDNYAVAIGEGLLSLTWLRKHTYKPTATYHCAAFLNANVVCAPVKGCFKIVETCWGTALGLRSVKKLVDRLSKDGAGNPRPNGILIKKCWEDNGWATMTNHQWILYLAKAVDQRQRQVRRGLPAGFGAIWNDPTGRSNWVSSESEQPQGPEGGDVAARISILTNNDGRTNSERARNPNENPWLLQRNCRLDDDGTPPAGDPSALVISTDPGR